ncbi:MAG: PH domain-containing protein [Polaribacter sp.]|uniref:PH domain-containing protein n=1 Tax=Polaribacter sp. TaxID=1920175 RepID=UPI003BAFD8A1
MTDFKNNVVSELPDITKIDFIKINKKYFKVISINTFIVFFVFLTALIFLHFWVFEDEFKPYVIYFYFGLIFFFSLLYSYLYFSFSKRKYAVRDKDISYKRGILVKKITTVPFSRIQHIEIDEKPISRIFNLASISVFTAGDSSDDLMIKGITLENATKIKEFISIKIDE